MRTPEQTRWDSGNGFNSYLVNSNSLCDDLNIIRLCAEHRNNMTIHRNNMTLTSHVFELLMISFMCLKMLIPSLNSLLKTSYNLEGLNMRI